MTDEEMRAQLARTARMQQEEIEAARRRRQTNGWLIALGVIGFAIWQCAMGYMSAHP